MTYGNVGAAAFAGAVLRYLRLHLPGPLPTAGPPRARPLLACLTTVPGRLSWLRPAITSLLAQDEPPDAVVLSVPAWSRREARPYLIPRWIRASPRIVVLAMDEDRGPGSKLLGPLLALRSGQIAGDPLLLAVDDDVVYPRDFVSTLLRWHRVHPGSALGCRGWSLPPSGQWRDTETRHGTALAAPLPVDVLTATWGLLVEPGFFDEAVLAPTPAAWYVDDVWFSAHLARRGVPRLVVPAPRPPLSTLATRRGGLCYGENADGRNNQAVLDACAGVWEVSARGRAG